MVSRLWQRLFEVIPFVLISLALVSQAMQPIPAGPWEGIYTNYRLYWILVGAACASMLAAIHQYKLSWMLVGGFALLLLVTVVSHSLLWAPPWGWHDAWRHLGDISDRRLAPSVNVYPLFHSLFIGLSVITGLDARILLSGLLLIVAIVGVPFAIAVVRRMGTSRTGQQAAAVVIVPGLFIGFNPRPFTLAYPFLLFSFWLSQSRTKGAKFAAVLILVALVLVHPFIAILATGILLVANGVSYVQKQQQTATLSALRSSVSAYLFIVVGVEVTYILFVASGFSDTLVVALGRVLFGLSDGSTGGPAGTGLIAEAFSSPEKFIEFLQRSSFLLSLSVASLVTILIQVRRRSFSHGTITAILSGLGVFCLFLLIAFIPAGIGVSRLFVVAPLFFLPLLPYAFSARTPTRKLASIGLAVLIVTTGLLTGFLWPGIGGVEYSATEPQVSGVEWATEHTSDVIVGTSMTHWVVVGQFGWETSERLSVTDANGMLATKERAGDYPWEVTDRPRGALYVIDGVERARAHEVARESDRNPVSCMRAFELNQEQVYNNGDTDAFIISQQPTCAVTA